MIFSVWTKWIRAKGKEIKKIKNSSNDMKRNENSGGYGAVNISTSTSVSGITELFISVKKNIDRVF